MAAAAWLRCSVFSPLVSGIAQALVVIVSILLLVICLSHWHFAFKAFPFELCQSSQKNAGL